MAGEIATAFVRIRPNMAGFQAETESGVKKAFSGLAEAVGVAFGAAEVFHFGKDAVEGAADLEHQIQNIHEEFGQAAGAVISFGETAAAKLGISAIAADRASNRFGLFFQQIGIGPRLASAMTINLENLAGSLATIRGMDPASVLDRLPLALSGNVRVLKSLGLAVDQTQVKYAALKLGLISNIKEGLTPAVKAEAIYALVTANLGTIQAQAAKHAGSLTNVQARLSAEWSNAKDKIGAGLLPVFTKYATQLANWLDRMNRSGRLQREFNSLGATTAKVVKDIATTLSTGWHIWQTVAGWIGGSKNALVGLFAILTVNKIRSIGSSIANSLVKNGLAKIGPAAKTADGETEVAMSRMKLATIGLADTIRGALISLGIGALAVAVGLVTVYVIDHWAQVKAYTIAVAQNMSSIWGGFAQEVRGEFEVLGGVIGTVLVGPLIGAAKVAAKAFGWVPFLGGKIKAAAKDVENFTNAVGPGLIKKGIGDLQAGGQKITDTLYLSAAQAIAKTSNDSKTISKLRALGKGLGKNVNDGVVTELGTTPGTIATSVSNAMKAAIEAAQQRIHAAVAAAKDNLDKIGAKLGDSVNKLLDKLSPAGPAGKSQREAITRLQKLIQSGAPNFAITKAAQELSSDLQNAGKMNSQDKTARHDAVKRQIANLTDAFNQGEINLSTFNRRLTALLKKDKVGVSSAGKELGGAFAHAFEAEIKGLREQAAAIAAVPRSLRGVGGGGGAADIKIIRPLEVIRRENQIIGDKAARQRERQIKAQERAAKAAEKTASNTAALKTTKVGNLPGDSSKKARGNAKAGVQP